MKRILLPEQRKKQKDYQARWYANNRATQKANRIKRYLENKDRERSNNRKWASENKERKKAADAKWRAENKERRKATNAAWYAKNRGAILAKWPTYKAAHPENNKRKKIYDAKHYLELRQQKIASVKKYYLKNRHQVLSRIQEWNKQHPERNVKYSAKWRSENRDFKKIINARWAANNPDKVRAKGHRRRARKYKNSTPEQIKAADLKIIQMLSHRHADCAYCAKRFLTKNMHVEHIVALARGGSHSPENICMSCGQCNESKNAKLLGSEWLPPQLALLQVDGLYA